MFEFALTDQPSRPGWDRGQETAAIVSWTGDNPLFAHLEDCRRHGCRSWFCFGLIMPEPAVAASPAA